MGRSLVLLAVVIAAAGCGGSGDVVRAPAPQPEPEPEPRVAREAGALAGASTVVRRPACRPGEVQRLGDAKHAWAAFVRSSARAYREPGARPFQRFGRLNVNGVPTIFGVLARSVDARCEARWYRVQLPAKPNGVTGWVRAADVGIAVVRTRILVDLSDRRVTVFRDGKPLIATRAAIGSPATPTPTGRYYVNQRLRSGDPGGPFGPGAIGISAFSEVLTGWVQGGPIAIHGTNRPDSIGRAVSNGCIRVDNGVVERLFRDVLAGTPVVVRA